MDVVGVGGISSCVSSEFVRFCSSIFFFCWPFRLTIHGVLLSGEEINLTKIKRGKEACGTKEDTKES